MVEMKLHRAMLLADAPRLQAILPQGAILCGKDAVDVVIASDFVALVNENDRLLGQVAVRDAAIEEWSGTAVQNGMECDRLAGRVAGLEAQLGQQHEAHRKTWRQLEQAQAELAALKAALLTRQGGLVEALANAAQPLETIGNGAGKDEFMQDMADVRGYARSRAAVARAAMPAQGGEA